MTPKSQPKLKLFRTCNLILVKIKHLEAGVTIKIKYNDVGGSDGSGGGGDSVVGRWWW